MAKQLQLRRGNYLENETFIGAEAEMTFDTERKDIRIHDGSKRGGYKIPTLVDSQTPTAENGYTWFRLWSDGWVEQGGTYNTSTANPLKVSLPVSMLNTQYTISLSVFSFGNGDACITNTRTPTTAGFLIATKNYNNSAYAGYGYWQVSGMAK